MKKTMIKAINPVTKAVAHIVCRTDKVEDMCKCIESVGAEYKTFEAGKMPLTELPAEVQEKVKSVLKAYSKVGVVYEYGKFNVSAGTCIKAHYNYDHFVCGDFKAEEVYTEEERRQNYIECFGC